MTAQDKLNQAGLGARQAREKFLDTVAYFGPADKKAHEALTAWGIAHENMCAVEYEVNHNQEGMLIRPVLRPSIA